ncbi:MAG TPA: hypothetical protein VHX60_02955 [Acidobacteriaceae bacterium]|nr:hypothetical protein [Acidobacteriaceae bacterium]
MKNPIRKLSLPGVKRFPCDGHSITVDRADAPRVEAILPRIRATQMTAGNARTVVFIVNLGTDERPVWQPLSNFIMQASMTEAWVLRNRDDIGDYRKSNMRRA